jgi:hypothetical protein
MSTSDWGEMRGEVMKSFQDGEKDGKDHVEVTTGLLWIERQRNYSLCAALEEILRVAGAALDRERPASSKPANLLHMVIDPGTGLPSRHRIRRTLMRDGQSHALHEIPAIEAAVENCTLGPGQICHPRHNKVLKPLLTGEQTVRSARVKLLRSQNCKKGQ